METTKAIYERKSIRKFNGKKVPKEIVLKLIDSAQQAPSACNQQLWKFIAIDDEDTKRALSEKGKGSPFFKTSPLVIVVLYKKNIVTNESADTQSAAAAIENMLLTAENFGLGATWINHFGDEKFIRALLGVPEQYRIISTVVFGYPAEKVAKPSRPPVEKIISFNKFNFNDFAPNNIDPKKWSPSQVFNVRDKTIRQTSPNKNAFPYGTKKEFDVEINTITKMLNPEKKIVEFLPFAGTHTKEILEKVRPKKYVLGEGSDECFYFIKERIGATLQKSISREDPLKMDKESNEQVIAMQKLENFGDLSILEKMCESTKKHGKLILSFSNRNSFFGAHYFVKNSILKKKSPVVLPFKPLNPSEVSKVLKQNRFKIISRTGISPFPFIRGLKIGGPLSGICKIVILECEKSS